MQNFKTPSRQEIQENLKEILLFLPHFLKNPILGMKNAPNLEFIEALLLQLGINILSGFGSGLIEKNFWATLWGVLIFPIVGVITTAIFTLLFHYVFLFLFQKDYGFRPIYILIVLASIPYLIFRVLYPIFPTIEILGFAISGFLLVVGFVENLGLPKKKVLQIVLAIYGILIVVWLVRFGVKLSNEWNYKQTSFQTGD